MGERTLTDGRAALARRAEIRRAAAIRDHELAAHERAAFYRVVGAPTPPSVNQPTPPQRRNQPMTTAPDFARVETLHAETARAWARCDAWRVAVATLAAGDEIAEDETFRILAGRDEVKARTYAAAEWRRARADVRRLIAETRAAFREALAAYRREVES